MESQPKPTEIIRKLEEEKFVDEITRKLDEITLQSEVEPSKQNSFSKLFGFKNKSPEANEVKPTSSFMKLKKSSSSMLNRMFGKKEKEPKEAKKDELKITSRRSFMKWIKCSSSQLQPIKEETPKTSNST